MSLGPKRQSWTPDLVVLEIRKLRAQSIVPSQSYVVRHYPALYGAAQRFLGGWRRALIAAGEDPAAVASTSRAESITRRTKWTRDVILRTIRERFVKGLPLNVQALKDERLGAFLRAAGRHFGNYGFAVRAAGIEYGDIRHGTDWVSDPETAIVAGIRALAEVGHDLNISAAQHHNSGLVTAAIKHFGSWDSALLAAGFDPEGIRLDVDTEAYKGRIFENLCYDVFAVLRPNWRDDFRFQSQSGVMSPDAYDPDTGEWIDFKIAAWGMSVQKSIRKYLPYAPSLRFVCLAGARASTPAITFESILEYESEATTPDLRELFARIRALRDYDVPITSFEQWATRWTRAEILQFIQELPASERHSRHAQLHHKAVYKAAVRMFSGWYAAVEAAGFDVEIIRRRRPPYSKTDVDQFIRARLARGESLSVKAVTSTPSGNGLFQATTRFYGSWDAALAAHGIQYDQIREKPGKEKFTRAVLDAFIRSRHAARAPLNATVIRDNYKGEYGSAFRIYGGWREAVEANGISYEIVSESTPPRRIEKAEVDAYIRSRHAAGLPLNTRAVCCDNRPIHTAACRKYYGSWEAALEANGIPYCAVTLRPRRRTPLL